MRSLSAGTVTLRDQLGILEQLRKLAGEDRCVTVSPSAPREAQRCRRTSHQTYVSPKPDKTTVRLSGE